MKSELLIMVISQLYGLILNQSTKINLNDIVKDIPSSNFPIYIGGPVEKNIIQFIHTLGREIPIKDLGFTQDYKVPRFLKKPGM